MQQQNTMSGGGGDQAKKKTIHDILNSLEPNSFTETEMLRIDTMMTVFDQAMSSLPLDAKFYAVSILIMAL